MGFQPNDPGSRLNNGSGLQIPAAAPNLAKPRQRRTKFLESDSDLNLKVGALVAHRITWALCLAL
jgi:hypothetical protein